MPSHLLESATYEYGRITADAQLARMAEVVTTGRLAAIGGTQVPELERLAAFRTGRAQALAVSSATAGVELALRALGAAPGAEVVIPALGWVSVGAAASATGAAVRVVPVTSNLTPSWDGLEPLIGSATKAVVVAHLRGMPATEIERIAVELRERGIPLIEDCAQAWGVRSVDGRAAGARGTVAVFSCQAYKLIAAGEGGLVLCDDPELMARMRSLSGDTRMATERAIWRGNVRMSEPAAALAIPQLQKLDQLMAMLRPLQFKVAELFAKATVAERVLPTAGESAGSNGTHVGTFWSSAESARRLWAGLYAAGLRGWHPAAGDLHVQDAWPVRSDGASIAMDRYIDVQIPVLDPSEHDAFLRLLQEAAEEAGLLLPAGGR
ncbi:aminotransferase class I/II-fold pyridoxal phosphate-dependent enzyme [Actinomadura monticuli]|uniref:Aminotransferase class V-fold PLP-dependent enzyme n=1 Tax=Actinomadura monticuli TaxID=3097367 RepID=A0ABV4QNM4_9ACTN